MKIDLNTLVQLEYELLDASKELVESTQDDGPVTYVHGHGEILPGLEQALEGVEPGAELTVTLAPEEAYGPHDPDGIVAVPRSEFPPDAEIVPGDYVEVAVDGGVEDQDEGGNEDEGVEMVVVEIRPDTIFLDANHPLAGQQVTFQVKVLDVRTATPEDIAEREAEHEHEHEAEPDSGPDVEDVET